MGAGLLAGRDASAASATEDGNAISGSAALNFALNLEYLEAEFYSFAVYGHGLPSSLTFGTGRRGPANEDNFLLGAFIFENVGVAACKGTAPLSAVH